MLLVILFSNSENDFGTDKFGAKFTLLYLSQWKRTSPILFHNGKEFLET